MKTSIGIPDFTTLSTLYQENPAAFEALRRRILNDAVNAAPAKHRIGLQCTLHRIEASHKAAATPLEGVVAACRMMNESWGRLMDAWDLLQHEIAALQTIVVLERVKRL
jgi:hypothetical protein